MPLLEILNYPHPVLRKHASPIARVTDEIRELLDDMAATMYDAPGIGLAAPQVGHSIRAIVIDVDHDEDSGQGKNLIKLINPEIISATGSVESEEGCLSLPGIRDYVARAAAVTVKAIDPDEKEIKIEATDLLAACLQHEIDHLNGVLIIDHFSRLKRELAKAKLKKNAL